MSAGLRRTGLAAILAITAVGVGAGRSTGADGTRSSPLAIAQVGSLELELIDQDFSFTVDSTLRLVYRITGDLEAVADLVPPTTSPPTTIPTTTVPPTTVAPTTVAPTTLPPTTSPPATPPPETPPVEPDPVVTLVPTTPAPPPTLPPTTVPATTLPPPVDLTVDVANYSPLSPLANNADYLDDILGDARRPNAFEGNVDGVGFLDARQYIAVDADGVATLTLEVATDLGGDDVVSGPDSLEFPDPGLYPLRVRLLVAGEVEAVHGTIVERLPTAADRPRESAPINLAVVGNVSRTDDSAGSALDVDEQLDRVIDLAGTIESPILASIPPLVLASAMDGADADEIVTALDNDELVALTDVELDVSSAVAAGESATFARRLRIGEDVLTDALPTTPSRRDVWVASEPLSAAGAQQLRDSGFRFVVMTPELYVDTIGPDLPDSERFVDIELPDGGALPVILIDELSESFTDAATDDALRNATETEWALRTVTDLVLDHRRRGRSVQRSRVLSTPTLDAPNGRLIAALETMAATTPDLRFVPTPALTGTTDTQPSPTGDALTMPENAGPDLVARIDRIGDTQLVLASAGSMLSEEDDRPTRWADALEMLVSTAISDGDADAVIDDILLEAAALRDAVVLPEPFTFTMTSRSDDITLRLGNLGDQPLTVVVRLSSSKLTFPDNNREVTLRSNDSTDVSIPVRARSNGTSPMTVEVFTPLGEQLGEPVILTSRVNALTGLAQVLTGAFILMLLSWWFTNWRNRRRQAQRGTDDPPDGHPGDRAERSGSPAK